jgi:hypothetical protein
MSTILVYRRRISLQRNGTTPSPTSPIEATPRWSISVGRVVGSDCTQVAGTIDIAIE